MKRHWRWIVGGCLLTSGLVAPFAWAAPPWSALIPFKRVDADPSKAYALTEDNGPWLVMCRSFAGDTAAEDAHELVLELRERYRLKAYVHKQHYDFTKPEIGLGFNRHGGPKLMVPQNGEKFDEIAVLVGDFETVDDPKAQKALEEIKYAHPKCLDVKSGEGQSQRYWGLRLNKAKKEDGKGPMRMAFITRNPLLPEEYFTQQAIDPLVKEMNQDLKYSLLKCPGAFSVRIATFRGASTMKIDEIARQQNQALGRSKLEEGAVKAHKLVEALRKSGVEAYEFHDRDESMVCVGSFESAGNQLVDGTMELNPAVQAVIDRYKAREAVPGQPQRGMLPQRIAGVTLDVQPTVVTVPRESIGAAYARRRE